MVEFRNCAPVKDGGLAAVRNCRESRARAYPPIGDQLDAIWKQLNYDRFQGREMIQDVDDMLGDILAVKAKYPEAKIKANDGLRIHN